MKKTTALLLLIILPTVLSLAFSYPLNTQQVPVSTQFETSYSGVKNVTCYSSPDSSYQVILNHLNQAQKEIDLMIYSISHYYLIKQLNDTMEADPTIKINIIACEQHSSGYETSATRKALWELSRKANATGADVHLYWSNNTEFLFTHAKLLIVDNETVLIQSANWAKRSVPNNPTYGNREWGVAIT
ncbi:MAG: phospholipase D-like domain-containing protein, partial [Candidatus Odinarchaeia archaeon]